MIQSCTQKAKMHTQNTPVMNSKTAELQIRDTVMHCGFVSVQHWKLCLDSCILHRPGATTIYAVTLN